MQWNLLKLWKQGVSGSSACPSRKKLMTALETGTVKNLRAGFWKTGIFPLNKNEVLQRLPSAVLQNDLAGMSDCIGDVFLEKLRNKREETTRKQTTNRRKKMNVSAREEHWSIRYRGGCKQRYRQFLRAIYC